MESRGRYEVRFEWGPAGAVLAAVGGPLSPGALFRGGPAPLMASSINLGLSSGITRDPVVYMKKCL
jgi:hypothetical protein